MVAFSDITSFLEASMATKNTVLVRFYQNQEMFMGAEIHYVGVWLVRTFEGKRNGFMTLRFPVGFHQHYTIKELLIFLRASFQGKNLTKWYVELNGAYQPMPMDGSKAVPPAINGAKEDGEDKKNYYNVGQNHLVSYLTFMVRQWRTKGREAEDMAQAYLELLEMARKRYDARSSTDIQKARKKAAIVDQKSHSMLEKFMSTPINV